MLSLMSPTFSGRNASNPGSHSPNSPDNLLSPLTPLERAAQKLSKLLGPSVSPSSNTPDSPGQDIFALRHTKTNPAFADTLEPSSSLDLLSIEGVDELYNFPNTPDPETSKRKSTKDKLNDIINQARQCPYTGRDRYPDTLKKKVHKWCQNHPEQSPHQSLLQVAKRTGIPAGTIQGWVYPPKPKHS